MIRVEGIELPDQFAVFLGVWVRFVDPIFELVAQLMDLLLPCPGFLFTRHDSSRPNAVPASKP